MVDSGWVPAGLIDEGAVIAGTEADSRISITDINVNQEPQFAYNLTVDSDHTYFVGETGMWVHNACKYNNGGGKNAAHANADKRAAGQKRLDAARKKMADAKRNGASKAEKRKIQKQIDHEKKKADFSGENHSMKPKG